jgi:hypothetical protein
MIVDKDEFANGSVGLRPRVDVGARQLATILGKGVDEPQCLDCHGATAGQKESGSLTY